MVLITLVGESVSGDGREFYYSEAVAEECSECKLKKVCFNLEDGSKYRIVKGRDQTHQCALREDSVRVVEVEKIPNTGAVPKKLAIDGSLITFQAPDCGDPGCQYYKICHPTGAENGRKYTITEVGSNLECPWDEKMVFVKFI
jgi:uncharacterized protein (UPF0179 family)